MNTAAYIRVSSDRQDVARQRESINQWATREGLSIDHWFEDSEGRNPRDQASKRPEFQKMLKAVEAGLFTKIVVDSQDRFGTKDAYEFGKFLTLLRENNCELWSTAQGNLTRDDDATILTNIIGALTSTREQKEKAARNVGGKAAKAKSGEYQGGYPAYGMDVACFNQGEKWRVEYVGHHERWKVYPDGRREAFNGKDNFPATDPNDTLRYRPGSPERLEVVRNIFSWYATENLSAGQIATRLNNLGITTTVGTPWHKEVIKPLLKNPVYIGLPAWNKRGGGRFKELSDGQIVDVTGKPGRKRDQKDYVQPEKPEFAPVISLELWNQVQAKIEESKQDKRAPAQVADLWLKPFLVCFKCGKPMRACKPGGGMKDGTYFCGTYGTYGKDNPTGCRCHRVKHPILEALVWKYLEETNQQLAEFTESDSDLYEIAYRKWMDSNNERNELWLRMNESAEPASNLEDLLDVGQRYKPSDDSGLQAEIDAKEAEIDEMLAGFFKLSPKLQDRANARMEALQAEIDALKAEVEDLSAPWAEVSLEAHKRAEAAQYAASLGDEDGPKKAEALRKVVDKIVCHFRYQSVKSIIDSVEIHPVSGEIFNFTGEVPQGRG